MLRILVEMISYNGIAPKPLHLIIDVLAFAYCTEE